jgi:hypothetical protein
MGNFGGQTAVGVTANHLLAAGEWGSLSINGGVSTGVSDGRSKDLATRIGIGIEF